MTASPGLRGWSACRPAMECYGRRRQTPATVTSLAPYTMCRRASTKSLCLSVLMHLWFAHRGGSIRA